MALQMEKFIQQTIKKYGTITEYYHDNEIDAVLIPDQFLDEERIEEVLYACSPEAWDHVYANRRKYSVRIQKLVEPRDFQFDIQKLKRKVVDLTDEIVDEIEQKKELEMRAKFDRDIWPEMKKNVAERHQDELDDEADDLWDDLMAAKQKMTVFLSRKSGRYVPPHLRGIDHEHQEIEDEIAKCQKAFDEAEKRISEADDKYWEEKANEQFEIWMFQL
jgi:hypothetical protein